MTRKVERFPPPYEISEKMAGRNSLVSFRMRPYALNAALILLPSKRNQTRQPCHFSFFIPFAGLREAAEEVPSAALRFPSGGPAGRPTSPFPLRLNTHRGAIEGNNCLARQLLQPRLSAPASGHQGAPRHFGAVASRGIRVAVIPLWPPVADLLTFLSSGSPPRHWRTATHQRRNFL